MQRGRRDIFGMKAIVQLSMIVLLFILLVLPSPAQSEAVARCLNPVGKIISIEGKVTLQGATATLDGAVCPGDEIKTAALSRAAIWFNTAETVFRLDQLSSLEMPEPRTDPSILELLHGALYFFSRTPQKFEIKAPFVNANIEGTEFILRAAPGENKLIVYEGHVLVRNSAGETRAGPSSILSVEGTNVVPAVRKFKDVESLQTALINAVDWVLYYPPLFDNDAYAKLVPEVKRASRALQTGQISEALALLPLDATDNNSDSLALKGVAALVRGDGAAAIGYVERALSADPQSVASLLALSYIEQARFDFQAALNVVDEARQNNPNNAIILARLAELQLATGRLDEAQKMAQMAANRTPNLAQIQMVLGFANLTRLNVDEAQTVFERAIALDSSMPLARLGLGLVLVRKGELRQGRAQLEQVVALDPLKSLYRSYLGKAFYEEKRDALAEVQLRMAKELDPFDPTPWLYSAILELTQNRPVNALRDLEQSIKRNDNRAIYRSKLLLDEDLASRSASLARIYNELGYQEAAILESTKSLDIDPGNFSAHRFLSDAFARKPGFEIASVSERLQAQLFQPINVLPVQPRLAVTDIAITSGLGPATPSLNEYTPLFQADGHHLLVSLLGGNQDTWGDELVLSGIHQRLSYSLGQFHAESDGFRDNNDSQYDLYNLFSQFVLSPKLNLQMELQRRESEQGDLRLRFDLDDFDPSLNRSIDQDTVRLGAKISPRPDSDLILSAFYSDRKEKGQQRVPFTKIDFIGEQDGYQAEARYLYRSNSWNITLGLGRYDVDEDTKNVFILDFPEIPEVVETSSIDFTHDNAYLYANLMPWNNSEFTLGLSYDDYERSSVETNRFNPKFGLRWDATNWMQIRLAAFKTVKRALIVNQTIEPTQIAGFNQFFDDFNGTRSTQYSAGLDLNPTASVLAGLAYSKRDMKDPEFDSFGDVQLFSGYGYWTVDKRWALRCEILYEDFDRDSSFASIAPKSLKTALVPLGLNYHHPNGFYANLTGTYIRQKIKPDPFSTGNGGSATDDGIVVNLGLGFRLPKQRGIINITAENLFDKQINFQDNSFRTPPTENVRAPYSQEFVLRSVLSLNY